jgi:hypothetical protein
MVSMVLTDNLEETAPMEILTIIVLEELEVLAVLVEELVQGR